MHLKFLNKRRYRKERSAARLDRAAAFEEDAEYVQTARNGLLETDSEAVTQTLLPMFLP